MPAAAVLCLAVGCAGSRSTGPQPQPRTDPLASATSGVRVSFSTTDGRRLSGRDYGFGSAWTVLVRGDEDGVSSWSGLVGDLTARGFRVLTLDPRGSRRAESRSRMRGDVKAALGYARSRGASRLFVVAAGRRATVALTVSTGFDVRALVVLSPRVESGERNAPPPDETRAPKLIIVGSLDDVAAEDAETVFHRSIGWAVLNSAPVKEQGIALLSSSWGVNVREQITAFLLDYLFL